MGLMKGGGGGGGREEIVQVQGGHIVRTTGRKDRRSKVYTAKGPRDRRMRLSAHTSIQFYDIQDRLGFYRPSKAVEWLIHKAKSSIDKLTEFLPQEPPDASLLAAAPPPPLEVSLQANSIMNSTEELATAAVGEERGSESPDDGYNFPIYWETGLDSRSTIVSCASSLFHSQLDTTPFFTTSSAMAASSSINFDDYCSSNEQDLGLSLHPFQAPNFVRQQGDHINQTAIFPMTATDYPPFMLNPPPLVTQPLVLGQTQSSAGFLQRGTLQSSFTPSFRSYEEFRPNDSSSSAHHWHSLLGGRFLPEGNLPGFCIRSQMQQVDEHGRAISGRPTLSSSSPSSSR